MDKVIIRDLLARGIIGVNDTASAGTEGSIAVPQPGPGNVGMEGAELEATAGGDP